MGEEDEVTGVYKSMTMQSVVESDFKIVQLAIEDMVKELLQQHLIDEHSINLELGVSALLLPKV